MTKEDYIQMKAQGQFTLPFFYQYYVENIEKAKDKTVRSFQEFEAAFGPWFMQQVMQNIILENCKAYFDNKFSIT